MPPSRDNYLLVACLVSLLSTSELNMKSVAFGTAGLVLALSGSLLASAPTPANDSQMQPIPAVSLPPSMPLVNGADKSFGLNDSFLVVDKGELDMADSSTNDRGANQNADHTSV